MRTTEEAPDSVANVGSLCVDEFGGMKFLAEWLTAWWEIIEHRHVGAAIYLSPFRCLTLNGALEKEGGMMKWISAMKKKVSVGRYSAVGFVIGLCMVIATAHAQGPGMGMGSAPEPSRGGTALVSEAATASVTVGGGTIDIRYNTPHMRGRKIMGELVPFGKVWRTGANPATTMITSVPLKFGTLLVPAGTHTLYTLPAAGEWKLIINNQTGQWGTEYKPEMDLGRVAMTAKTLEKPQEIMSISFEKTSANSTQLHVRWETTDEYVTITKP